MFIYDANSCILYSYEVEYVADQILALTQPTNEKISHKVTLKSDNAAYVPYSYYTVRPFSFSNISTQIRNNFVRCRNSERISKQFERKTRGTWHLY